MVKGTIRTIQYNKKVVDADAMQREIRHYFERVERDVMNHMTYYPPYDSPTYVRTGTLGAGWVSRITTRAAGLFLVFRNSVHYAKWVQGDEQRDLFAGIGWYKLSDVLERYRRTFRQDMQDILKKYRHK